MSDFDDDLKKMSDELRPRGARVAVKILTGLGGVLWVILTILIVVFASVYGVVREGVIWGCW